MALKFRCKNCGKDIAVRFLTVGETAECRNCGASNAVPESAKSMIQVPASKPAESTSNGPAENLLIVKMLRIIGIVSIGFGVIAGTAIFIAIISPPESPELGVSKASQTISGILSALGMILFFGALGTFSLGIAKVLELLNK